VAVAEASFRLYACRVEQHDGFRSEVMAVPVTEDKIVVERQLVHI